jgi:DNA-binding LacI/PurR family transcriptional regulator
MEKSSRATLRDVAASTGHSAATVSRALRGDRRITEAVRKKILRAAQKLGYRRDPKLAQLMSHLRLSKRRSFQGTLAWITNLDPADSDERVMI